nr:hypothetical protein [Azoarcus olearius]
MGTAWADLSGYLEADDIAHQEVEVGVGLEGVARSLKSTVGLIVDGLGQLNDAIGRISGRDIFPVALVMRPEITEIASALNKNDAVFRELRKTRCVRQTDIGDKYDPARNPVVTQETA